MNTWPDAGMTPFRNEKNSNWEGAFRVPSMIRWPGKIEAGTVSNEIVAHKDWLPTILDAAGEPEVKEKLKVGHQAGDKVLEKVALVLREQSRTSDTVCRYGGEEFVVILPEADKREAFTAAERIRNAISASPFFIKPLSIDITVSVGVAETNAETQNLADLINIADHSMYQSKQHGGNQTTQHQ